MRASAPRKFFDRLLVALFLFVLFLPLVASVVTEDRHRSDAEKRALAKFPDLPVKFGDISSFLRGLEQYYNDHFGLRELLIYRYQRELEKRFRIAGSPLVVRGENGWLFYTGDQLLEDFRGERRLSRQQLERWAEMQRGRQNWLQSKGIEYLTFAPPSKQSVYAENLPARFRQEKGPSRLSQLHDYLHHSPMSFYVDIHKPLLAAKKNEKMYYATDSHWTPYGAYVAFRRVMEEVQQRFPERRYDLDFAFADQPYVFPGGDLAEILMSGGESTEEVLGLRSRTYCSRRHPLPLSLSDIGDRGYEQPLYKKCPEAELKALFFADSFIWQIERYFSENFSEVVYLQKPFDRQNVLEVMELFTPDIVIEEKTERNFFNRLPEK